MTAKQTVLLHDPQATIRRCESALKRSIEFRISWAKDGKGNYQQATGQSALSAWVNAKNLIEKK